MVFVESKCNTLQRQCFKLWNKVGIVKAECLDFASCSGKVSRKMIINWYSQADATAN